MNIEKMFETATREMFRFPFRGLVSVEDLWCLSIEQLDSIFKVLNSRLKQRQEESLLDVKTEEDSKLEMKIDIVKYIVKVKLKEQESRVKAQEKKEKRQKILEILSEKQDQDLYNKSTDELESMLNELDD